MQPPRLPILFAVAALFAAPAAHAFSQERSKGPAASVPARLSLPGLSLYAGNFGKSETRHPGLSTPPGAVLRWGTLGPDRNGGLRFGAKFSGPGGTWTLDHSDAQWRGRATHRLRLGFSRRF